MPTYNYYNTVPVKRNTITGWASDAVIYPAGLHLQVTDDLYTGTDQPRFKIANGVDAFAALDYVPAGAAAPNTIYTADDSLTGNRTVDGDGYSLTFSGLDTYSVTTGGTIFADVDFNLATAAGVALNIYGDRSARFHRSVGIGDDPQSDSRLQVYTNSLDKGINCSTDASASKAGQFTSNGANGTGGKFTCQAGGGLGGNFLGDAAGIFTSGINGPSISGFGQAYFQPYGGASAINASAMLQVDSTTKGSLDLPRMTTTQRNAISSPAVGLGVYDTTTLSQWRFDGTNWIEQ